MPLSPRPNDFAVPRRRFLLAGGALVGLGIAGPARAQAGADNDTFALTPDGDDDQSVRLQQAIDAASRAGRGLRLAAGTHFVHDLALPSGLVLEGVPGATVLAASTDAPVATISGAQGVTLSGIGFSQGRGALVGDRRGLLEIADSEEVRISACAFSGGAANSLMITDSAVDISGSRFAGPALAAIFSVGSRGLMVSGCRISDCGNGGILVWREEAGADGSIVTGNRIERVRADAGGNGQNGNGVNIFRADGVIVADNQITGCAFSAVRVNSGADCAIRGNVCTDCGEVAIYSEFAFSGSVVADNTVDRAATGISITNFDQGGRLATCTGNIVRNITKSSPVNPDVSAVGIYAEADTVISDNVVDTVPGIGIAVGYGPYLRDVVVNGNVVRSADIGIAVSVAEGAGRARIAGNLIGSSGRPMVGKAWEDVVSDDLVRDADRYPFLSISGNMVD